MNHYLVFLEALFRLAKKLRTNGALGIQKHLSDPGKSSILSVVVAKKPEGDFLIDAMTMATADVSLDELLFYLDGYRQRLVTHDKADIHLVNMIFRSVWAIAHPSWDAVRCSEYGRAAIPAVHSLDRLAWQAHCNQLDTEKTQTSLDWATLLDGIKKKQAEAG